MPGRDTGSRYKIKTTVCVGLLLACCAMLKSGCLVVNHKRLSKPSGPADSIGLRRTSDYPGWAYFRSFRSNDFNLDVGVLNSVIRSRIGFWFYVLPLPDTYHETNGEMLVQIDIAAKAEGIVFDPWRTLVEITNATVAPQKVWIDDKYHQVGTSAAVPVDTHTSFFLDYGFRCNPDLPFELSIHGLRASGQEILMPPIVFSRAKILRPQFILPY